MQRLLDAIERVPAFALGRRMDVLAWNRMSSALLCDFDGASREQRNMLRHVFLDPADPEMAALIGELTLNSDEFAQLWTRHDVREKTHGTKRIAHPLVGEMTLEYETLRLPDPDQVLAVYTAEPGSASAQAVDLLGSLAYSEAASSTK